MEAKNDAIEVIRLKDAYGPILTERQAEILTLFYDYDNSLSEIAEQYGVSRQAIRDTIERAKSQLFELESKLNFADKILQTHEVSEKLSELSLRTNDCEVSTLAERLEAIWEKKNGIVFRTE